MTPEQFTYWLQGYAELNEAPPTAEQWQSIREHLQTVFTKVTPPVSGYAQGGNPNNEKWLYSPQTSAAPIDLRARAIC